MAIAGVPLLAGFFSKDEILFETFAARPPVCCGSIGVLTSLLTATYMFRLVYLTFHGERAACAGARGAHARCTRCRGARRCTVTRRTATAAAHGHARHLHDAPPAMAIALIVLAIGSVLAGYIGIPHALGGHNTLGEWLQPSFVATSKRWPSATCRSRCPALRRA